MATPKRFAHGQFSWVDLSSHGMAAAEAFYGEVFGWQSVRQDTQGGPPYSELRLEGRRVAGLGEAGEEMKAQGIPPVWNSYITVDDIEETTKRAVEMGGDVTVPVMQILDAGRLAFIRDATGGHVGLWQPKEHGGVEVAHEPGSFCWSELATRDLERACEFYGALFGWEFEPHPEPHMKYYIVRADGERNAGLLQMTDEWGDLPPHWMVYFAVADMDATVERIQASGGSVCVQPFDTSAGRIAVVGDAQGATFTVIQSVPPA